MGRIKLWLRVDYDLVTYSSFRLALPRTIYLIPSSMPEMRLVTSVSQSFCQESVYILNEIYKNVMVSLNTFQHWMHHHISFIRGTFPPSQPQHLPCIKRDECERSLQEKGKDNDFAFCEAIRERFRRRHADPMEESAREGPSSRVINHLLFPPPNRKRRSKLFAVKSGGLSSFGCGQLELSKIFVFFFLKFLIRLSYKIVFFFYTVKSSREIYTSR